ncbi:MAG: amidohydrolase, partial [Burkholderiales bacterium]|nr:amidohydrolase [Burkholderiales bacterium]
MTYLLDAMHARAAEFVGVRRDIHRHPELAFDEHRTASLVAAKLESWGYAVERGVGGTGVVGKLVRGAGARCVGLRADMDALPIDETTGANWTSVHDGVMHACG